MLRDIATRAPEEHAFTYLLSEPTPSQNPTGRLSGWVLSAKDLHDVAGMPTSMGSVHRTYTPDRSDEFIAALEAEGARFIGKSAAPELGLRVDTEPVGLPHPDNPLWPGCTPGGSSGGAAVQVARGLVRAAHGSDGGGSLRVPAAACGVVAFKPAGADLSVEGFITRSLADSAFLHDLSPTRPRARIGLLTDPLFAPVRVADHMVTAAREVAAALGRAGYTVVDVAPYPEAADTFAAFTALFSSRLKDIADGSAYSDFIRDMGRGISAAELASAHAHADTLPARLAAAWGVDAIVTPMLAYDPPPKGTFTRPDPPTSFARQTEWTPWGSLSNVGRLPAACIPWPVRGRTEPVGVQLAGISLADAQLLGLAQVVHR